MTNRLAHRGPDGSGFAVFSPLSSEINNDEGEACTKLTDPVWSKFTDTHNLALGHCRLAVIDQSSRANQPMSTDAEQRYWITYNGEVYNFQDLRYTLESAGYEFFSQSDTEVVLNAYRYWGQDCVLHFEGMWSFVIYDRYANTLFGSRDRLGVKPLYYCINADFFAFASEVKAFLDIPNFELDVNDKAVVPFLFASAIEKNGETFLKNVQELDAGSAFVYDLLNNQFKTFSYFSIAEEKQIQHIDLSQVKTELNRLLKQAVKKRLVADVPVGFCLSGGLDSSTILALAAQIKSEEDGFDWVTLKSFTAQAPEPFDESPFAKSMAESAHSDWLTAELNIDDFLANWKVINYHQDLPIISMSTYAQFAVMRKASANGIAVMLDGQGSDELFGGYPDFFVPYWNELLSKGRFRLLFREWRSLKNSPFRFNTFVVEWIKYVVSKIGGLFGRKLLVQIRPESAYLLNRRKLAKTQAYFIRTKSFFSLNKALKEYVTGGYLKNLLHWEDRCAMQFSIESRTPFSDDPQLISYALSLPSELKIKNGWTKWIVRQTMENQIPEAILNRTDKLGFSVPQTEWLMQCSDKLLAIYREFRHLDTLQIVNHERIEREWEKVFSSARYWKKQNFVFRYISYLIWLDSFQLSKN
jgi:asparagine synthase (glutamine-hydrolysing)